MYHSRSHPTLPPLVTGAHTRCMAFRVLIAGGRHFTDYPLLRATLDALLANRLPDVELLTTGGPGAPMLAASYATERGLVVSALVPDFNRFPVDAPERRDSFLVSSSNAAVVVWDGRAPTVRRILVLVEQKGLPVHVIGGPVRKPKARRVRDPDSPAPRGLPQQGSAPPMARRR